MTNVSLEDACQDQSSEASRHYQAAHGGALPGFQGDAHLNLLVGVMWWRGASTALGLQLLAANCTNLEIRLRTSRYINMVSCTCWKNEGKR